MRKALVIGLLLLAVVGCKRAAKNQAKEQPAGQQPAGQQPPPVHAPTGVVMNPSGGGSGGAAQAVRTAVVRTVNLTQMDQLRLFMETASTASATGQLPPATEVAAAMQREAPAIFKLLQDRVLVLTDARSRSTIWVYTADSQSAAGEHLVIDAGTVTRMPAAVLQQRLASQRGQ